MAGRAHFRSFGRQVTNLRAVVTSSDARWERRVKLVNLGLGGGCLELTDSLPVGARVQLRVEAPQLWDPFPISARIVWTGPGTGRTLRAGLEFDQHSLASIRTLLDVLGTAAYE
jgi:hypothetical protein